MNWLPATPELLQDVISRTQGRTGSDPESNLRVSSYEEGLGYVEVNSTRGATIARILRRTGGGVISLALDEKDGEIRSAFIRIRFEAMRGLDMAFRAWPIGESEMPRREGNPNAFGRKVEEEEEP